MDLSRWMSQISSSAGACPRRHMGGCQNHGPFLGTLNIRCRFIIGTQKGTIILTTTHMGVCRKGGLSRSAPQALCYIPLETPACYIPLVAQPSCLLQDKNLKVCRENLRLLHTLCDGVCNGCGPRALLQANRFGTCPYSLYDILFLPQAEV